MSSVSRVFVGILMAVGIAIVCLLPPLVHLVTGPLGPAIGGYLAGSRMKFNGVQAALLGLILGVTVGVAAPIAFETLGTLHLASFALIFFGGFAGLYAMLLSGVAAYFGGRSTREEDFADWAD